MSKRWRIQPYDSDEATRLESSAGLSPVLAQLLVARGICSAEGAEQFLSVRMNELREPDDLPGVSEAAERIMAAIQADRAIRIYGDYDADGMTGSSILQRCLQMLGANVSAFIPNRRADGYGLNPDRLAEFAEDQVSLVITVDCGIANVAEAERARQLGLELIVTDHHQYGDTLPSADVLVHPSLPGSSYPFDGLCGAGVALKLAWALCQRASDARKVSTAMREFLLMAMGVAAIGTVADVVPLLDENRIIVRHGLLSLKQRPPEGLRALMRMTGLEEKSSLTAEDIGFMIGPHLNAAGRLGQAPLGLELLTTDDPQRAEALATYLGELNDNRKRLERRIYTQAKKQIVEQFDVENDPAVVVAGRGWEPGVVGVVAGRLAEKYHRPTIVIAMDRIQAAAATGSGRSVAGLNLYQALQACDQHLVKHGGHAAAVGLTVEESQIDAFRNTFFEHVAEALSQQDLEEEIAIDAETALSQLTMSTVEQIEQLAPFGNGNPRPLLCAAGVEVAGTPKRMGGGDRHLSAMFSQHSVKLRAVAFGQGDWAEELDQVSGPIDIVYQPMINEFRGRRSVEIQLVDWRPAEAAVPATVKSA
jgi:single-stranded-DNA-specific exonuclease